METISIYVSFESEMQAWATRLDSWPWTNQDLDLYERRAEIDVHSPEAESIKTYLRPCIQQADVTLCLISAATSCDPWIAWELEVSNCGAKPNGLVGVMMHEANEPPPSMVDCGAIFVAFKRDIIDRAVRWVVNDRQTSDDFTLKDF